MGAAMILDQINYWTIPAGMVLSMLIGMIYYNPRVMGGVWMRAMEKSGIALRANGNAAIALTLPLSAMNSFFFAIILQWVGAPGPNETGMITGLWVGVIIWLGFSFTNLAINSLFSATTIKLFMINTLHFLILYLAMGATFGMMQWG